MHRKGIRDEGRRQVEKEQFDERYSEDEWFEKFLEAIVAVCEESGSDDIGTQILRSIHEAEMAAHEMQHGKPPLSSGRSVVRMFCASRGRRVFRAVLEFLDQHAVDLNLESVKVEVMRRVMQ